MKRVLLLSCISCLLPAVAAFAQQINVAGSWRITGNSSLYGIVSVSTGVINQNGNALSGQFTMTGSPCASSGSFTGTLNGTSMVMNVNENGQTVVMTGTVAASGNSASGSYSTPYGGCTQGDMGTWSGTRTSATPSVTAVVDAANYKGSMAVAGGIVSLFGSNLGSSTASAAGVPLPTTLGGATVQFNSTRAPLFYVSPSQINLHLPWELTGQGSASVTVTVNGVTSAALNFNLGTGVPSIFSLNQQGTGQGAIQIANTSTFAAPSGSVPNAAAQPAKRGDYITIYCTALGDVDNRPASGASAKSSPLSATKTTPIVTIGGVQAVVSFSGLAPGFVGLYQVNVQVPSTVATGDSVAVVLTMANYVSNTVTIAVQ